MQILPHRPENRHRNGPVMTDSLMKLSVMRDADPQITFADLEFLQQGIRMEPLLEKISDFLDDHDELVELVRCDLDRGLKKPETGRAGLTPDQVLRALILMRIKNWDYRELRERINDGYTLRKFTGFYSQPVPRHNAFNQAFNRLIASTVERLNDAVVEAAVHDSLEDGKKLRADTTVVETDIHWPTDATLLWDTVRVLTRLIGRLRDIVPKDVPRFPSRKRAARKRMQKLQRMTASQRENQQASTYRQLLAITQEVLTNARRTLKATAQSRAKTPTDMLTLEELRKDLADYCPLGDRVVDQARRRVLDGEQVPASEKLYSIFEPHTDLIKRGKINKPIEFGHKVFLAESAQGLVTQYRVLDGNPSDEDHVESSLKAHRKTFGSAPKVFATDRGFDNTDNQKTCRKARIGCASIPQRGGKKTAKRQAFEKSPDFKKAQRFRAGIEGRISVLFRGRGMKRCLARGKERFCVFIGVAVLANNLMKIAELLIRRENKKKPRSRAA
jgi:transposase, IS5 family